LHWKTTTFVVEESVAESEKKPSHHPSIKIVYLIERKMSRKLHPFYIFPLVNSAKTATKAAPFYQRRKFNSHGPLYKDFIDVRS